MQEEDLLNCDNYQQLLTLINTQIIDDSTPREYYWYAGLINLLINNELEADNIWMSVILGDLENSNNFTEELVLFLDSLAISFINYHKINEAIIINNKLKEITPNNLFLQLKNVIQEWKEKASICHTNSQLLEAQKYYELVVKFEDNNSIIWQNLALIYYQLSEYISAYQAILQAINFDSNNYLYFYYAGVFLDKLNYLDNAILAYQQAIKLNNNYLNSYLQLGQLFIKNKQLDRALQIYQEAIVKVKDYQTFTIIINNILCFISCQDAIKIAEETANLFPDNWFIKLEQYRLLPLIYDTIEEIDYYRQRIQYYFKNLLEKVDVNNDHAKLDSLQFLDRFLNSLLCYQGKNDLEIQLLYGKFVDKVMKANYPQYSHNIKKQIKQKNEKIKVGYISYCLNNHVIGKLSLGWIKYRNREDFTVYCYSLGESKQDEIASYFQEYSDFFINFSDQETLENIADKIINDRLDILVYLDLSAYPRMSQLSALRLAPIQCVTWLHPITSGIANIDYFLSSELMEGKDYHTHYSEKVIKLPNLGIVYESRPAYNITKNRAYFNLDNNQIIYLCSQLSSKYLPQYDYIYPHIATRVKNAQFIFVNSSIGNGSELLWHRIKKSFTLNNLDYQKYCIFLPKINNLEDYWQLLNCCDIFLDTIGFTGFNSTLDALESGLPVVTLSGEYFRTRQSEGILNMISVTDTVAKNEEDYLNIAIELGINREYRENIVNKIKQNISLLYNDLTPVKALENFYTKIVEQQT